jgi:hypothetical protein
MNSSEVTEFHKTTKSHRVHTRENFNMVEDKVQGYEGVWVTGLANMPSFFVPFYCTAALVSVTPHNLRTTKPGASRYAWENAAVIKKVKDIDEAFNKLDGAYITMTGRDEKLGKQTLLHRITPNTKGDLMAVIQKVRQNSNSPTVIVTVWSPKAERILGRSFHYDLK